MSLDELTPSHNAPLPVAQHSFKSDCYVLADQ